MLSICDRGTVKAGIGCRSGTASVYSGRSRYAAAWFWPELCRSLHCKYLWVLPNFNVWHTRLAIACQVNARPCTFHLGDPPRLASENSWKLGCHPVALLIEALGNNMFECLSFWRRVTMARGLLASTAKLYGSFIWFAASDQQPASSKALEKSFISVLTGYTSLFDFLFFFGRPVIFECISSFHFLSLTVSLLFS